MFVVMTISTSKSSNSAVHAQLKPSEKVRVGGFLEDTCAFDLHAS